MHEGDGCDDEGGGHDNYDYDDCDDDGGEENDVGDNGDAGDYDGDDSTCKRGEYLPPKGSTSGSTTNAEGDALCLYVVCHFQYI